ncbi:3-hydroxyacyl-CoA dehydrogenase [Citromicrobium sp. RCC1885]|uniref:3-hydroxyacyl-CoA dehydrogenase NAD-binding domain-containing protein n=1 Tax=unclassified Citromicrobium TaxID=2630544 RepID=UPI0006C92874|nr:MULTISPECIES: 3-hydroxyacyl-CoA dehydrogenase NAD-binding domain-containing protein [unclassified Citromicrobium]KPM25077.1 3-hydroxyacyl-CoA dehydrogenase [Citromicrobium sp. RCC1885]KPM28318.1 3-hydroxyacyl-CoA dehydrogenase [Citromicrobium sp. RCC1878]MAO03822.1 3-hydroxyacyl-CoA dehydrogenase [Citromicrobium sp.]OAM10154.1 3-hydroxyacyl-CoA dehydrogenase [Citromicrobium sp. RCC1897]
MTSPIRTERHDNVLVIISDNPPVNALGQAVRAGLTEGIAEALADDSVEAVVIRCDGRTFFAGADITEFGKPPQGPSLPEALDKLEASDKPVVAAIHGTALGGGCEVALACHYRVAVPSAKMGLPEVKLGLIPGAAGTQRLPRLVGAEAALPLVAIGNPISAKKAKEIGLLDELVGEDSLAADAIAFAKSKVGQPVPRSSEGDANQDGIKNPDIFDEFRAKNGRKMRGFDAPNAAIEAVRAAGEMSYAEGVKKERELFGKLMTGTQSKAMRHYFFAERAANKVDDIPSDTPLIDIKKVGIIGAGTMGGGIAMNFLSAGIPVTILEMKQEALDRGTSTMRKNYEATAKKGRMTAEQVEQAMGILTPTLEYRDLADCDLVIEAVYESMDVKKDVFGKLDEVVKEGAILASNTSYLNIDEIATATKRPGYVLGLHFFSPANVMKLLEVVRGEKTRDDVLATAMKLSKKIGKVAAVSGVCPGFIGNRMLSKRQEQANQLILEGANYWDVDDVLLEFGFPMGPFQMGDLAGIDIGWHRDPTKVTTIREALCAVGRFGQKAGKGFYDYDEARQRTPSDEVKQIIADFAEKEGNEQRDISKDEIRERLLYPMVNEGAKILDEGMAQRASDIDVVWINGYGWPLYTGGPMFWADTIGLDTVVAGLEKHGLPVSDYLRKKAEAGESFN